MKRVNVKGNDFLVYENDDIKIIKTGRYEDKEPNIFKEIAGVIVTVICGGFLVMAGSFIL